MKEATKLSYRMYYFTLTVKWIVHHVNCIVNSGLLRVLENRHGP